ncbi:hypothetical protein FYK55_10325 [Roseiconus nitratireducens]|uniref:Uncharacterized protein n=1 Tax=Roseiconus nitratireducens TaxID=2605748 RepID=A0A5M6DB25_9BACT|nr:hypothetical protein [Roseiconus nitratireducens]KAA5543600.1 hypothetical protein FYK55_10325 [Roseiconus nitratireducens]
MHCVTLADLAAMLAQHGPSLLERHRGVPTETIFRYWTASRSRHELWHRVMARYRQAQRGGDYFEMRQWWSDHLVVLEEILVSELLARVVAAIGRETAERHGFSELPCEGKQDPSSLAAITHGVFEAQLEASHRVGQLILEASGARVSDLVRLNRLRHGVERWTDWLIGRVSVDLNRSFAYSIRPERARAFCQEVHETGADRGDDLSTWLMNAAMRDMLYRRTSESSALPNANHQVAAAALALFRPELFDQSGVPKLVWLQRLQHQAAKSKPFDFAAVSAD